MTAPIYTEFSGLANLRREAKENSPEALKEVARQFEAIYLQMMLKSMRDAQLAEGIFDSEGGELYRDMFDKQMALELTSGRQGLGLADLLVRQLGGADSSPEEGTGAASAYQVPARGHATFRLQEALRLESAGPTGTGESDAAQAGAPEQEGWDSPQGFIRALRPHAERTAARLGVAPEALLAQAALETGWGKKVIRHPDGRSSFNLFNIKADHRWEGARVAKSTLEFRNGVAQQEMAPFRAYDSYSQSFDDYAAFLLSSPRYEKALAEGNDPKAFIAELHAAGYATDPKYAEKIGAILDRTVLQEAGTKVSG